jgi:farnesyl diphosphate synthase/geranylgeranyl diphosphate synthase type II
MGNNSDLLSLWREKLITEAAHVITDSCTEHPERFRDAMLRMSNNTRPIELSLLACGAARWCGGSYDEGMPAAVAAHLLLAAITAHASLPGFESVFTANESSIWKDFDEATAILVGDALVPLVVTHLVSNGGRHASAIVEDAMEAIGGRGVLAGVSLEQQKRSTALTGETETWELWAGTLSRFAAVSGARLTGATERQLDQISLMGLEVGRAWCMISGAAGAPLDSRRGQELHQEALSILEEARTLAGSGEEGVLLRQITGYFRNRATGDPSDLFF